MSTTMRSTHPARARLPEEAPATPDTTADSTPQHNWQAEPPSGYAVTGADIHCRAGDDYSSLADDALGLTADTDSALVSNLSAVTLALNAVAQSQLGLAYELRAIRCELISSGGFAVVADAICGLTDAVRDNGRETGALVQVTDGISDAITHSFTELQDFLTDGPDRLPRIRGA